MTPDASWVETMPDIYDSALGPALFRPFATHLAGLAAARISGPTWLQADAQQLDFPDASFDLVVCQFGVMFFPDKPAALAETARVLAPGGTMLLDVWDTVDTSDLTAILAECVAAVLPDDPPSFVVRVPHGYADPGQIRSDLQAGGLIPGAIDRLVRRGCATSAREVAEGFCLGTPLRFALQERGSLDDLTRAIGDEMTARLGSGPVAGDLAAFVVSARKPN